MGQEESSYEDFDYEAYERECAVIQEENGRHLDEFEAALVAQGLADKTISRHISNVDFYINTYLLREDAYRISEGCHRVDDFLGYFFIRKCMWSTPETIKQNIASFKKFYKCMVELGHVSKVDYEIMLSTIKECKDEWLEECERFNTPDEDYSPFGIGGGLFSSIYDSVACELGLAELLGVSADPDLPDGEPLSREEAIDALAISLMYLMAEEHKVEAPNGGKALSDRSKVLQEGVEWRTTSAIDSEAIARMVDNRFVEPVVGGNDLRFTKAGLVQAEDWLRAFGFDYLL